MSGSVAFLDESGDQSSKLERGASRLFVVGLAVFPDADEAARCNDRIDQLRGELHKPVRYEFHFRKNSDVVRRAFLTAVAPFAFTYYAITLEKPHGPIAHLDLYLTACSRVCTLAGESLDQALLIVDAGEKDRTARRELATRIRQQVNRISGRPLLSEVRPQDSARNNLVQLADYVTGVRSWWEQGKSGADDYRRLLREREGVCWRGAL